MSDEGQKKTFLIFTVLLSLIAVGLAAAAFATDSWVKFSGSKLNKTDTCSRQNDSSAIHGCMVEGKFGLFRGENVIDYGFGMRDRAIQVICSDGWCIVYSQTQSTTVTTVDHMYENGKNELLTSIANYTTLKNAGGNVEPWQYALFRFGYWVGVLVMFSLGIVWGLVSIGFTTFNIFGKPIETITGPLGLYVWNFLALLFTLIGVILYVVLYQTSYANNVLSHTDYFVHSFRTKDNTHLDYSFYLTIGSLVAYLLNIILLMCSGYKLRCFFTQEADKAMDNGIILY